MEKIFLMLVLLAVSLAVYADQGAMKELLTGPEAVIFCDDFTPVPGVDDNTIQDGFVIFNYDDEYETLMATVKLKGAEPYMDYPIRLIRGSDDCHVFDAILTTNRNGNGVFHWEELGVSGAAQVIIDTGSPYGNPTWRATNIFYY